MELKKALDESNCGMAELCSQRTVNRHVAMQMKLNGRVEVRIVKGFTDQTVVRRLRAHEIDSDRWIPLDRVRRVRLIEPAVEN